MFRKLNFLMILLAFCIGLTQTADAASPAVVCVGPQAAAPPCLALLSATVLAAGYAMVVTNLELNQSKTYLVDNQTYLRVKEAEGGLDEQVIDSNILEVIENDEAHYSSNNNPRYRIAGNIVVTSGGLDAGGKVDLSQYQGFTSYPECEVEREGVLEETRIIAEEAGQWILSDSSYCTIMD